MVESTEDVPKQVPGTEEFKDSEPVPECVMNEAVKAFEPTLEEIFIVMPSGEYQRMLFFGHELREKEQKHIDDFREWLKERTLTLPDGYDDENMLVLRFLQGLKWDYQKTYDEIVEHSGWKSELAISSYDTFKNDLELGVMYGLKRDS